MSAVAPVAVAERSGGVGTMAEVLVDLLDERRAKELEPQVRAGRAGDRVDVLARDAGERPVGRERVGAARRGSDRSDLARVPDAAVGAVVAHVAAASGQ